MLTGITVIYLIPEGTLEAGVDGLWSGWELGPRWYICAPQGRDSDVTIRLYRSLYLDTVSRSSAEAAYRSLYLDTASRSSVETGCTAHITSSRPPEVQWRPVVPLTLPRHGQHKFSVGVGTNASLGSVYTYIQKL